MRLPAVCRYELFQKQLFQLEEAEGGFDQFTSSYKSFGVQRQPDGSLFFQEWAPAAEALFLTGDFSKWTVHSVRGNNQLLKQHARCVIMTRLVSLSFPELSCVSIIFTAYSFCKCALIVCLIGSMWTKSGFFTL